MTVYRPDDSVIIVNSRFIERIGYPTIWTDRYAEFLQHPKLVEAMALLGVVTYADSRAAKEFAAGAAKAANRMAGFGGPERSIHYWRGPQPDYTGQTTAILSKRVAYTGTYYPSSGGKHWTDYGWEYEYEPGGLDNRVAHVILETSLGTIEACDVRPVDKC